MLLISNTILYLFLGSLITLFLAVVAAYYFTSINKRGVVLNKGYILGSWRRKGLSPEGLLWSFEFHFNNSDFVMKGDPEFEAAGKYRIVKEIENLMVLELYQVTGDIEYESMLLEIAIDKKTRKLTIDNRAGYERIKK